MSQFIFVLYCDLWFRTRGTLCGRRSQACPHTVCEIFCNN